MDINQKMSPEDCKLLIEENLYMQYALRVMNDINLNDESDYDYEELWNNIALNKKIDPGEVSSDSVCFAFNLLDTGINNFGVDFIKHFSKGDNYPILAFCIKSLLEAMVDYSNENNLENIDK